MYRNINPILVKELRSNMRGGRPFITLTATLVLLGLFSYVIARLTLVSSQFSSVPISPQIGQTIFAGLAFLELFTILAITPAITSGAISEEKEKLTFEMLLATPLHPVSVLWGKLVSSLGYIFLLIIAAVPMSSLVFIYGGVGLRDMIKTLLMLLIISVMVGVIGIFVSTLLSRTGQATAITYIIVLIIVFGPLLVAAGTGILTQFENSRYVLVLSPISAMASALAPSVNLQNLPVFSWLFGGMFWIMAPTPISLTSIPRPLYHYSVPIYLTLSLMLYMIASRLILPARRWRIKMTEALISLVVLIGFAGIVVLGYLLTSYRYENILIVTPTSVPVPTIEPLPVLPLPENLPDPGDNKIPPPDTPVLHSRSFQGNSNIAWINDLFIPDSRMIPSSYYSTFVGYG